MKKSAKISLIIFAVLLSLICLSVGAFFLIISPNVNVLGLPDLDESRLTHEAHTVDILDKDGNSINNAVYYGHKTYVDINEVKDYTKNAFIAVEDKRFYDHNGIDYIRVVSAAFSNIKSRSFREGASTITQQLIKNTHLSNEKTIKRKITEMRLARSLEQKFDKDSILESYFNILYFGSGIKGLGTASRVMFDKSVSELTPAQSAALASIINNPTKYSPYNNYDNLIARKNLVLKLMYEQGYLDDSDYSSALNEELVFYKKRRNSRFIETVIKSACDAMGCTEKQLFADNYTIKTGFDENLSVKAREIIDEYADFNGQIRILILDNRSGAVICDETNFDESIEPRRSPASTVKPFVSYAAALENGLNPLSQISDEPTDFNGYEPKNYKDIYRGWQSLEDCLIKSSNIAAVKLLSDTGIDKCVATAKSFGLPIPDEDKNLSLALGGMSRGLTLTEIANAYRTLANGGIYSDTSYINGICDSNNAGIYRNDPSETRAIGADTAYILTDMLSECAKTGTAKILKNIDNIAAKTGTNGDKNGNIDCYCIAYTPNMTIAVWLGAGDTPIENSITGASCCKIIKRFFDDGAIKSDDKFEMPDSVGYYEIDDLELRTTHQIYLADPILPKRYRRRALLSKRHLPIRKNIDFIDWFDERGWDDFFNNNLNIFGFSDR